MKKFLCLILGVMCFPSVAQQALYKDPRQPVESRVEDLLQRMTLEEKFWQLFMIPGDLSDGRDRYKNGIFGLQVAATAGGHGIENQGLHYTAGVPAREAAENMNDIQRYFVEETRLGIPLIFFDEALHGLIREGGTLFPQAIGLASTWDTVLMHQLGQAIALESRSRGIRQILSPVLNIARDVRWGRTEETYGEDPCLTGQMGHAYISELQRAGVIATPKHFAVNVGDGGRDSYPVDLSERLLEEVYFPAFRMAVGPGAAGSVMAAYNSLDGAPCSASDFLLNQKLRDEWGFQGFVVSDAGGTGGANVLHMTAADYAEATRNALNGGLDVIFQTSYDHYPLFYKAFESGMIPQAVIDRAVRRVLRAKFELGLFEHPYADPQEAAKYSNPDDHRELSLKAAEESFVLLRNENAVLPLSPGIKRIAVIGKDAATLKLGGYSGPGYNNVSILSGLRQYSVSSGLTVDYAEGTDYTRDSLHPLPSDYLSVSPVSGAESGLQASYFANPELAGEPVVVRREGQLNGQWTLFPPDTALLAGWYSARWTGVLRVPVSGTYRIGLRGNDGCRLYINDSLIVDRWFKTSYNTSVVALHLEKDSAYFLRAEYYENSGSAHLSLVWDGGGADSSGVAIAEAVKTAQAADAVVLVAGVDEGEFRDRASLNLPGKQEELIAALAATGKPLIVILNTGSAVDVTPWIDKADALLWIGYPGCEGGTAVANLLFGDVNPSGRLPFSWPLEEGQLPLTYLHKPTGRGDDYVNLSGMPRYPFGYGLSYTGFQYSDMEITPNPLRTGDSATLTFTLTNTGTRDGAEVVQLYLNDELASVARPLKELKAFRRVFLKAGESRTITFILRSEMFSLLNSDLKPVIEPGVFRVMIGASSADLRLMERLVLQ